MLTKDQHFQAAPPGQRFGVEVQNLKATGCYRGGLADMAIISWKKKSGKNLVMVGEEETNVDDVFVYMERCVVMFFNMNFKVRYSKFGAGIVNLAGTQFSRLKGYIFSFSPYKTSRHPALPSHVWCFRTL